jgi:hypothetical protein
MDDASAAGTLGPLPTFLIVGAAKAGTTSLAAWLGAHPDVFVAPEKEVHFFDRSFDRGVDWYRSRFAGARMERAIGEATPEYMAVPVAVERMSSVVPEARLIAILRDPVDRAYSQYWHQRISGRERRDFAAVVAEHMRDRSSLSHPRYYLTRGRYIDQLRRITSVYPRDGLLVLLLEDMRENPATAFRTVCEFIGVDPDRLPAVVGSIVNPRVAYRSRLLRRLSRTLRTAGATGPAGADDRLNRAVSGYPPMDPDVRSQLVAWFADANRELEEWLGRDLSAWTGERSGRARPGAEEEP